MENPATGARDDAPEPDSQSAPNGPVPAPFAEGQDGDAEQRRKARRQRNGKGGENVIGCSCRPTVETFTPRQ
ncbi:hypothetical protein GCM10027091_23450 [Streptomyces daliensis]